MVKARGGSAMIDEGRVVMESLVCLRWAGADFFLTYLLYKLLDVYVVRRGEAYRPNLILLDVDADRSLTCFIYELRIRLVFVIRCLKYWFIFILSYQFSFVLRLKVFHKKLKMTRVELLSRSQNLERAAYLTMY